MGKGKNNAAEPVAAAAASTAAEAPAKAVKLISMDEVKKHNKRSDAWVVVRIHCRLVFFLS